MQEIISKIMKTVEAPGDYTGPDGLLYCGKCHTPKQMRLPYNPLKGTSDPTIFPLPASASRKRMKQLTSRVSVSNSRWTWPAVMRMEFPARMGCAIPLPRMTVQNRRYLTPVGST